MKVGFIGWRGMVGSVLMQRMLEEQDFTGLDTVFFTTSNIGGKAPTYATDPILKDAFNLDELIKCDVLISCQGGDYTQSIYSQLRPIWNGYWIDAASTLRMQDDAVIILDPVNRHVIDNAIDTGVKNFIGGNCTVSLMLLALDGLFKADKISWITSMTYQAASGAGAQNMRELINQMGHIYQAVQPDLAEKNCSILAIDAKVLKQQTSQDFPTQNFGAPLAGNLIPWIDKDLGNGQSKEELKGFIECNKILNLPKDKQIPIESLCIRIGTMRSHAQALTICLKEDMPIEAIEQLIKQANPWVSYVPNDKASSVDGLNPVAVTASLNIAVGRLRKLQIPNMISLFTVGDQLLWGAAEPLRRMLAILRGKI